MGPSDWGRALREVDEVTGIFAIARRYFAMNAFDGVVTIVGVVVGSWAAEVDSARVVLTTGFATATAMAISGVWGAYLTESAERRKELVELEGQMLVGLEQTRIGRSGRRAVWVVTLVDGASPLVAAAIPLVPFVVAPLDTAWIAAVGLAGAELVGLGWFLGRVSGLSPWSFVWKTVAAGVLALGVGLLLHWV